MGNLQNSFHGSDLEVISARYHIDRHAIIPHASNVNPLGLSPMAREALTENIDAIMDYPDRNYTELRNAISAYCNIQPESLILGNGTSDLIRLVFEKLRPEKTVVIGPTYSEYANTARLFDSEVEMYMLSHLDDFEMDVEKFIGTLDASVDLIVICNPNNPTSKVITTNQMDTILKKCQELNILVMVDETYVEFVTDLDKITSVPLTPKYENLIVLRSVSKFFAAPGLRLGYAITKHESLLEEANSEMIPWNINAYATVASVMFQDEHYISLTKSLIQTERNLIYSALTSRKTIKVYKPETNFVLIKLLKEEINSTDVFEHCIEKGIMIRDCANYEGLGDRFIRLCFLKPEQNDAAVNAILDIV